MAKYRLRSANRKPGGSLDAPILDDFIDADTPYEAIKKAKNHPAILAENTGYTWLTDSNGTIIWEDEV
jgi:hypothetical protein